MTPLYTHDCDLCRFLGQHRYDTCTSLGTIDVDLYVCREQDGDFAMLVARRSSDVDKYASYDLHAVKSLLGRTHGTYFPGIEEAYRRFTEKA